MKPKPESCVISWLDRQLAHRIWLTSVTLMEEARFGLVTMPEGKRKRALIQAIDQLITDDFDNRVLPFDAAAAERTANLLSSRQQSRQSIDYRDTQIAGVALAQEATLATRNIRHFPDLGLAVLDPWEVSLVS